MNIRVQWDLKKIKNGEITYNDIMKGIKNGHSNISWVNIKIGLNIYLCF